MKKTVYYCAGLFLLSLFVSSVSIANDHKSDEVKDTEKDVYQLIVLMASDKYSPDVINQDIKENNKALIEVFGSVSDVAYLISDRRKIGFANKTIGLSPEEVAKFRGSHVDLTLVHPQSIEARLQRYMVLSYASQAALEQAKKALQNTTDVMSVLENKGGDFLASPNDPFFQDIDSYQWGMFDLNLPDAWDKITGHAYIGIPDSGLNINHPDLTNYRPQFSKNFDPQSGLITDTAGHGTHVTGIIAATMDNNIGVAGVCPGCSVAFGRIRTFNTAVTEAYTHLLNTGVQVINSSWAIDNSVSWDCANPIPGAGGPFGDPNPICDAIQLVTDRDIMISAATGNGNNEFDLNVSQGYDFWTQFPAADPRVIAVGATDNTGGRANYSNYGPELDLVAPGSKIQSTISFWSPGICGDSAGPGTGTDNYGNCTGTSMSAPHITGVLGLIRSADPLLNNNDTKIALISSGPYYYDWYPDPSLWKDPELGYGVPDTEKAINQTLGTVDGTVIENRLTPLFSFYSTAAGDSFYTTVPQMATAANKGTLPPQPTGGAVGYLSHYGSTIPHYTEFPHGNASVENSSHVFDTPTAEVYIFTTEHNPIITNGSEPLVPLYRLSYQGTHGSNTQNIDHTYTTEQSGITVYENSGYLLDGIEGYIFSNQYPKPEGAVALHRRYNSAKDDHAIFPESKLTAMIADGYTIVVGSNSIIGYVYLNEDADNDNLIDGFERSIGTCIYDADSDDDGISDGDEVLDYPRTDPANATTNCEGLVADQYPWQHNAVGTQYSGISWHYAMGYHFTPQVNGRIIQLGGQFDGTKTVKLFNKATGALLATTSATSTGNGWGYGSISPVNVQAGTQYTVAVYLAGSGASYRASLGNNFYPKIAGDIQIDATTFISTSANANARPININVGINMFGQADIGFEREHIAGDANGDGIVTIDDVIAIINIILAGGPIVNGSDCNLDGVMNTQDTTCTINIVLNQ